MSQQNQNRFLFTELALEDDYEGRAVATLIESPAAEKTGRAMLYIHGFVDHFFQTELAAWANGLGFDFYALELRKYGRSMLPHQKPNNFRHYTEYFEEMDLAVEIIRGKKANTTLVLTGHSTGGLISSLYTHHRTEKKTIDALILNSPFFDFNAPAFLKKTAMPFFAALGRRFPDLPSPLGLKEGYPKSLHKDFFGEWDFDLVYKPIKGFKINFGWINAIFTAQKELQAGLAVQVPVLVMHAEKSITPGDYRPEMQAADAVLDVQDIARFAPKVGKNVSLAVFAGGMHDLVLSKKPVREKVYKTMKDFLRKTIKI